VTVAIVVITVIADRRSGKGELTAIASIEDELGTAEDPVVHDRDEPPPTEAGVEDDSTGARE
ncbi:MAG: hypothetical protein ABW035_03935, partial [Acidimicrobiales bacterium]